MKYIKLKYIKSAVDIVWKSASIWTILNALLTFLQSVLPIVFIYLIKVIIDQVNIAVSNGNIESNSENVFFFIILAAVIYFLQAIISSYIVIVREYQNKKVNEYVNSLIHQKSIELELLYFENSKYQDIFHRASQEATYRPVKIVNGLFQLLQSALSIILLTLLLLTLHWAIAIVLIIACLPQFLVRVFFAKKVFLLQNTQTQDERRLFYFHRILTGEDFAKEIRIFGLGGWFMKKFKELDHNLRTNKIKIIKKKVIADSLSQIFIVVSIFSTFIFIASQTIAGVLTIGAMVMYFMAFQKGMGYLKDLINSITNLYEDNLFISNLNVFLSLKPQKNLSKKPIAFPNPLEKGILFENVCFQYPNTSRNVLNQINLFIPQGKTIAIVGQNGVGKSTLVKLICGLYQPNNGQILFDNIPSFNINKDDLRANISVVFQDYVLFNMSAKENIWFGNIFSPIDEYKIKLSAKNSNIDDVLSNLPNGYDTILGKLFDNSEELSIGEWQKIAIAKAFYKNSQIIILDEPTSSLDAKSESELYHNFRRIIKDKTAIIISHRFSTVRMADYIVVLDNETIAEYGSHQELLSKKGIYANFYYMQNE